MEVLLSREELSEGIDRLAHLVENERGEQRLVLVGVLTGSIMLVADLLRRLDTGLHGFHVVCGMVIMAIIAENDIKNERNWHRVENIGLYWHFVDIVWIFLFPLMYIAK
jgi:hypoxanthine-guanine phosphoribosyltransferase